MKKLESAYALTTQLHFWGTLTAASYCYYALAKAFLPGKSRAWPVGASYLFTMLLLYYMPFLISNFLAYTLGALAGLLSMYLLDRRNLQQKAFLAVTFFSLRWMAYAAETTLSGLIGFSLSRIPGISENAWMQLKVFALQSLFDTCLSFALLLCAIRAIQRVYTYKREKMTGRELALLFIPSLSSIAGYAVLQAYRELYQRDTSQNFYDAPGSYQWICLLYYAASFLSILAVIILFQSLKNRQEEEKGNRLLLGQVTEIKRHISEIERIYGDIRSLRHDMKNHILTLERLRGREKQEAAKAYMETMQAQLENALPENISGNPVTDVILSEWRQRAKAQGIRFDCQFHYPQQSGINAFDISVILNNALSNALAGAQKSETPFIQIRSCRQKNTYLIEISNSFAGEICWNEENSLPKSSKPGPGHGLGIYSIRRVAQKYLGDIDIACGGGRFTLSILLMAE